MNFKLNIVFIRKVKRLITQNTFIGIGILLVLFICGKNKN